MSATTSPPAGATPRYIGQAVARKEDPRLLTGQGEYVDDLSLQGMLHVAFARSPHASALIRSIDASAAKELEGVRAVLTGADLNGDAHEMKSSYEVLIGSVGPVLEPLASARVKYVGDPVVMVIAESRAIAEDAIELLEIEYDPQTPVIGYETSLANETLVHPEMKTNLASVLTSEPDPALDRAFANAVHIVQETIRQHRYINVPMETRGLIASWHSGRGEMTFYSATQLPNEFRTFTTRLLAIPENKIRVIARDVGGGFGQKAFVGREEAAVLLAAKRIGRPLKWIEDRWENLVSANHAREELVHVRIAFDADYRITAVFCDHEEDIGALPASGTSLTTGQMVGMMFPGPYKIPHAGYSTKMIWTNTCGRLPYRGPWMMETVAREIMIDIAARRLGIDALELRRRNTITEADMPYTSATGMSYDRLSIDRTLEKVAAGIDFEAFRIEQGEARAAGRLIGIGLSHLVEPTAAAGGSFGIEVANIRMQPSGYVDVYVGTGNHGQGTETTMAQIVADTLGIEYEKVFVHDGDTDMVPFGGGSGASRTAVLAGAACHAAGAELRGKIVQLAAHYLEAAPEDLEINSGKISVRGTPTHFLEMTEVAFKAYNDSPSLPPGMSPGLEATARHAADGITFANATHACIVEVDPKTYRVKVLRYLVSSDCGVVINPAVVEGQIAGGVIQGIGGVLFEHFAYDENGNPLTTTFMDYLLPTAADVPTIEYAHLETPAKGPGGYKGVGEGGAIASPPAIVNAVADALGMDLPSQPLSPSLLFAMVNRAPTS
ncbi:MAG: Carbon-monoxide dehydrogenase (acceptor) [Acidimicrobiales bacterium]|nr:Carbon-monoxide dehydrogenase (acceptor) [Acidimicrobiales bacterium]